MSWAARARAHFSKTEPHPTDETDKTPLSSVSSVTPAAISEKHEGLSSVSSVTPCAVFDKSRAPTAAWLVRAQIQETEPNPTDKTDETPLSSVSSVTPSPISENSRTCRACTHRLPAGTCSQPVAAGLREHYSIVWPEPTHAATCPAYTTKPQAVKTWPHAPADDAELATMAQRQARFERLGLHHEEAARLADKLLLRDREGDDRRLCLECTHLRGRPGAWRCPTPGGMGAPLVAQLQRCPSWGAP